MISDNSPSGNRTSAGAARIRLRPCGKKAARPKKDCMRLRTLPALQLPVDRAWHKCRTNGCNRPSCVLSGRLVPSAWHHPPHSFREARNGAGIAAAEGRRPFAPDRMPDHCRSHGVQARAGKAPERQGNRQRRSARRRSGPSWRYGPYEAGGHLPPFGKALNPRR